MPFIEIQNVSKCFPSEKGVRHVLEGVNLEVDQGEFVAICGYSGSGKSTLIAALAGLTRPDCGHIAIRGSTVAGFPERASIVFQNYSLLPWFSALENVRLALEAAFPSWPRREQQGQAEEYLRMVGLGNAFHKRPAQLSGGMRQRVAIARAFATEPELLLLDEPFGALDALTRANLQQELARMCSEAGRPVTTVMITNSVQEAILLADRIVPMTRGPRASLGPGVPVPLERPRASSALLHDPRAVHVQNRVVEFLTGFAGAPAPGASVASAASLVRSKRAEVEA